MKKEIIELNPHVEDLISEVMERTILKRQDIINWFANQFDRDWCGYGETQVYRDWCSYGKTDDLIGCEFYKYKKDNKNE